MTSILHIEDKRKCGSCTVAYRKTSETDRVRCLELICQMIPMSICVTMESNFLPNCFTVCFIGWSVRYKCTESWSPLNPPPHSSPGFVCLSHLLNWLLLHWALWGVSELHLNSHPSRQNSCVCCVNKDQWNSRRENRQISWLTCSPCVSDEGQIASAQVETVLAVNELSDQVWRTEPAGLSMLTGNFHRLLVKLPVFCSCDISTSKAGKNTHS